jgi:hypothetical protein
MDAMFDWRSYELAVEKYQKIFGAGHKVRKASVRPTNKRED